MPLTDSTRILHEVILRLVYKPPGFIILESPLIAKAAEHLITGLLIAGRLNHMVAVAVRIVDADSESEIVSFHQPLNTPFRI